MNEDEILLLGDFMIDEYIYCDVHRISPEAPVPIAKVNKVEKRLGGAGNVLNNLISLGCKVTAIIPTDNTEEYKNILLQNIIKDISIPLIRFTDGNRIIKTRVIGNNKSHMLRIDREEDVSPDYMSLFFSLKKIMSNFKYILISDYGKGSINNILLDFIRDNKRKDAKILIDPSHNNYPYYPDHYIIKLNDEQYKSISLYWPGYLERKSNYIIQTKSERGVTVHHNKRGFYVDIEGQSHEVVDVTGAGDVFLAVLTKALIGGFDPIAASYLANNLASYSVTKLGTISVPLERYKHVVQIGGYRQLMEDLNGDI